MMTRIGSRVPVPKRMGEFGSSVHRSGGSICSGGAQNPTLILPIAVWMVASWRVSRLRNMTLDNYQNRVTESVAETIKEQISVRFLEPLFQANNIPLPPGRQVYDVLERMVEGNPVNLQFLSQMYSSLETFGAQSQFYIQARAALCVRLSNQMNSGASIEKSGRGQEARFRPWRRGKGSEDKDTKVDWFVFMLRCLSFSVCSIRIERKISPDLI
ncbi:hypothetical protein Q3G72_032965 [Acer saccharum]|nr:hypothetical protein Q3G72_032965 [Acer saccharum]